MDLKSVSQIIEGDEEVVDVPLIYRNGEPILGADGKQATVGLIGNESQTYKKMRKAALRLVSRKQLTDDEAQQVIAARGARRWSGIEDEGQPAPFSEENALKLLKLNFLLWQFEAGIRRDSDFFKTTSTD